MVHTKNQRANYRHRKRDGGQAGFLVFPTAPQQEWARRMEKMVGGMKADLEEVLTHLKRAPITWIEGWKVKQAILEGKEERHGGKG